MENIKVLWLIAARSGSKSIPNKNIKKLAGIPLLGYRIKSVLTMSEPKDVWISTDSKEYADIAKGLGATVPFIRPDELASDAANSMDVVMHAVNFAEEKGLSYDAVALLEPTSPFITTVQLKNAVEQLFNDNKAENIVAVRECRPHTFFIQENSKYLSTLSKRLAKKKRIGRQDFNMEITPSGGFYIAKWGAFKKNNTFYSDKTLSFLVSEESELEIDEPIDWLWAEFIVEKQIAKNDNI